MQRLAFAGHYGQQVNLDLCRDCDLIWFDDIETAQLSGGPALLELIGAMASSHDLPHEMLRDDARCPRCDGKLGIVHNQSRWGRSSQLQCLRRHGAYQSFAQFLEEKGLLRPMSRIDRAKLLRDRGRIECVNCGGEIAKDDERCRYCRSIPSLLDVARLARALDPLETIEPPAVFRAKAKQAGAAMRGLRRRPAAGRDDQLLAVRSDARDHQPGRCQRQRAGARAGAARRRRASAARAGRASPERARRRPAATARVGGGNAGRSRRAARPWRDRLVAALQQDRHADAGRGDRARGLGRVALLALRRRVPRSGALRSR